MPLMGIFVRFCVQTCKQNPTFCHIIGVDNITSCRRLNILRLQQEANMDQKDRIEFEVVKHFGVLGEARGSWNKELNLVAWNGREPKLDVRDWSPEHEKMGKGITLSHEEAAKLAELLKTALV